MCSPVHRTGRLSKASGGNARSITDEISGANPTLDEKQSLPAPAALVVRPFLYFIYRYFVRLGFLGGKEGLIFHFPQAFWYRFLIDAKLYEHRKARPTNKGSQVR